MAHSKVILRTPSQQELRAGLARMSFDEAAAAVQASSGQISSDVVRMHDILATLTDNWAFVSSPRKVGFFTKCDLGLHL